MRHRTRRRSPGEADVDGMDGAGVVALRAWAEWLDPPIFGGAFTWGNGQERVGQE